MKDSPKQEGILNFISFNELMQQEVQTQLGAKPKNEETKIENYESIDFSTISTETLKEMLKKYFRNFMIQFF